MEAFRRTVCSAPIILARRGMFTSSFRSSNFMAALSSTQLRSFSSTCSTFDSARELQWTRESKRTGAIATKLGMTALFLQSGERVPVTGLLLENCQVTQVKTDSKEGFFALQVGARDKRPKNTTNPMKGHFEKAGVPAKQWLKEFPVTEDALLPVGTAITAKHFLPGQYIDVTAITTGKGFQGVMKRHGYSGQAASHGVSKTHRHMGSTGNCQDPGRVWKGKKMPGHMGGKQRTMQNVQIVRVDPQRNIVFVRGQVPGTSGKPVVLKDAVKKDFLTAPPFPTCASTEEPADLAPLWMEPSAKLQILKNKTPAA